MTLHRPPLSIDAGLARIAGQLPDGWAGMAQAVERSESLVRAWGQPGRRERIPLEDAIRLDLAYRAAGGTGAPLYETYGAMLDAAGVMAFADEIALGRHAALMIKETAEANAAAIIAAQPGRTDKDRRQAMQEVEEAIAVLHRTRVLLGGPSATGPP
ncbi:hypothetical protein [Novosphingobium sp. EMRT-2]|uniref:hypothetical protein n=1 Tax=Novosphingobium sp. EMRT-2 TaxID=2571749 RepID=UPI0010BDA9DB|nr:hypothetical protein [Novosphingobium sp. EMRT-2]QCI92291.1 hypothetical protein FA702_01050 [Novosphingobium sp. EMRT-2]